MDLPYSYVVQQIYINCKRPYYNKSKGVYNAECPVCGEGSSSGKRRRMFYYPDTHMFQCFNCPNTWSEINWIKTVTHKSYLEIKTEAKSFDNVQYLPPEQPEILKDIAGIPPDSVNLYDKDVCDFYIREHEKYISIKNAIAYCEKRRLFTAINRPKAIYYTFDDFIHKKRLIIPFHSLEGKVVYYQSRTLNANEYPKYLCKGGDKTLYGLYNVDITIPYLFLFEGAIDAMFVKNGLAMAGLDLTTEQLKEIEKFMGMEIIYVYDNDVDNEEVKNKIRKQIKKGKKIFIMPDEYKDYKDINEICTSLKMDEFPWETIVANTYKGTRALLRL